MISLQRNRTTDAIHSNFHGSNKIKFEKELMVDRRSFISGVIKSQKFNTDRWKKAKEQLYEETHNKCAYCETPTKVVAYGDVEHFRPKSKYWWLAYCYDNYLVSCQLCNQAFKSDHFPLEKAKMRGPVIKGKTSDELIENRAGNIAPNPLDPGEVASFVDLHQKEGALLLNPYFDDPARYFAWKADDALREVELVPREGEERAEAIVEAAERYYGLNRPELKQRRWLNFIQYRLNRHTLDVEGIPQALRDETEFVVGVMREDASEFAGMVRYYDDLEEI